ncbi:ATP-binding protein [Streptomyces sp. NPDC015492]|uniref:ATP-binding protein n=1 Tax=Streptomyces sp. NPDC015492 TaxID=3364958 RepID=UPI0037019990
MNQQNITQVHGSIQHFSVLLSPTPRGARLARLLAVEWMRDQEVPYGVTDSATQVVAELAANAATHGRVPGRSFRLAVVTHTGVLRVEVTDTQGEQLPRAKPADSEGESGRGLLLVEALADRWGVDRGPAPRKTVWAELDLPHR